jgi:probable HAF family extracellular repeat protein
MRKLFLIAALAGAFVAPAFASNYMFSVIGGTDTYGAAVNEAGHVAVSVGNAAGLFNGSKIVNLGSWGGKPSVANDINNLDQVVGYAGVPGTPGYTHAFLASGGAMNDLGTLGGKNSKASAINDTGVVVGYSDLLGSGTHGFVYTQAGGIMDLGTLGGNFSMATDVNAKGDIVGFADTAANGTHSFHYSNGVMTDLDVQLGLGRTSDGFLIKTTTLAHVRFGNSGAIIGDIQTTLSDSDGMVYDYWTQAAIYNNGQLTKLPAPYIGDVNAAGVMLTNSDFSGWLTVGGLATDLNQVSGRSDIYLQGGWAMNGSGQLLVYGTDSNHNRITGLLTPVPEPETWAMLLAGLAVLGRAKRRQRQDA